MTREIKKIALINPKKPYIPSEEHVRDMFLRNKNNLKLWFSPPLNLLTIAAHTPSEIEIKLIDEHFEEIDFNEKFDIVGLTAMTQQAFRAYEIAAEFRKRNVTVVLGGIHASILPDEALKHVDTVFIGEAEEEWEKYLNQLKTGKEKKIYKNDGLYNVKKSLVPRYELINYKQFVLADSYFKFLPIQATRGCPNDCSFCVVSEFYGKKVRKQNIDQVVKQILYLKELHYDSLLFFVDDNLFVDRKYAKALLKEIIPLKVKYVAASDIRVADDPELLDLAYRSGCVMTIIGFESIDTNSLKDVNKNDWKMNQIKSYPERIRKIQENGIIVYGAFVIGFDNDKTTTFEDIKDFVIFNNIPAQLTLLTPLPGSRIYKQFKNENKLYKDVFWENCSFFNMNFKHNNISKVFAESKMVWFHDEVFNDNNVIKRNRHMMHFFKNLPQRWNL